MTTTAYSLTATARGRGTTTSFQVTAQLDITGSGRGQTWWFVTKVDGRRAGDAARFPFLSLERPPLEAASREVVERVAGHLGIARKDVIFAAELTWQADE